MNLPDHISKEMLAGPHFTLGIRAQFYYHWSTWANKNVNITQNEANKGASQNQQCQTPSQLKPTQHSTLNLGDILSEGPYGPGVLKHYSQNGSLNDRIRKLLVDAFLHYCATNNISPSKADCKSLSMQI